MKSGDKEFILRQQQNFGLLAVQKKIQFWHNVSLNFEYELISEEHVKNFKNKREIYEWNDNNRWEIFHPIIHFTKNERGFRISQ